MLRRLALLLGLASALAPSGCGQTPTIDAEVEPVIHGTLEHGYPEVVAIYWMDPTPGSMYGALCSGTVIGPHAILTAKHCVFQEPTTSGGAYVAVPSSWFYIIEGYQVDMPGNPIHRVSEVRTTPGTNVDYDVMNGSDIAILLTPDTLTVTPRGYATVDPSGGAPMTVVGFGRTMTGTPVATDSGVKYSGPMAVRFVSGSQILASGTSWTCQGDSGGPLIDAAGNVAGITSFGFDSTCLNSNSVFTNVASWTSFIADALTWAPPCVPHTEICNGLDDDCDGAIDNGLTCAPLGAPCTMNSDCTSHQCSMPMGSTTKVCTRGCFADTMIDPCPTGTHCEVQACGSGYCLTGAPGAGAPGDPCTAGTDCATGYCATLQGRHVCGRQCWPSGGSGCSTDLACNLGSASDPLGIDCGACLPLDQQMGPRGLGDACTTDVECGSMHCSSTGHYCTEPCAMQSDCPSAWHCNGAFCAPGDLSTIGGACTTTGDCAATAPDCVESQCSIPCTMGTTDCGIGFACYATAMGDHCLRQGAPLGGACTTNDECRSGQCLSIDVCTQSCDTSPCPTGFDCVDAGGPHVCVASSPPPPASSSCGCSAHGPRGGWAALALLAGLASLLAARRRARA